MSAHALNCYDTIKTRERTQSFKRREAQREDGSSGSVVTNTRRNSSRNSKLTLYPIEIIEETDQQVKIHYTGYSGRYDEWICKSQIGYKPVPLPRCLESLQSHNLSILACCIKQKLIPSRKMEDPKVRIQLAFNNNSVELLKQQAVLLTTQCHGHQSYGIKEYKDLNELGY